MALELDGLCNHYGPVIRRTACGKEGGLKGGGACGGGGGGGGDTGGLVVKSAMSVDLNGRVKVTRRDSVNSLKGTKKQNKKHHGHNW